MYVCIDSFEVLKSVRKMEAIVKTSVANITLNDHKTNRSPRYYFEHKRFMLRYD